MSPLTPQRDPAYLSSIIPSTSYLPPRPSSNNFERPSRKRNHSTTPPQHGNRQPGYASARDHSSNHGLGAQLESESVFLLPPQQAQYSPVNVPSYAPPPLLPLRPDTSEGLDYYHHHAGGLSNEMAGPSSSTSAFGGGSRRRNSPSAFDEEYTGNAGAVGSGSRDATPTSSNNAGTRGGAGNGSEQPPKKKRRRQALSCTECKRRKIKCDRVQPCTPCKRRGEGDRCHWHVLEPV